MPYTFKLSDGSLNTRNFIVDTNGISLDKFRQNPVMLYNHDINKVIGKWDNIKIINNELHADAVFDSNDDEAKKIENKVKDGFLKGASIGIQIGKDGVGTLDDGTKVVKKSILLETSLCAIPANSNAIRLYNDKMEMLSESQFLSLFTNTDNTDKTNNNKNNNNKKMEKEFNSILLELGVSSLDAGISKIKELNTKGSEIETLKAKITAYEKEKEDLQNKEINSLIDISIKEGRITEADSETFKKLAKNDFELAKKTLGLIEKKQKMSDAINGGKDPKGVEALTFDQLRKTNPTYLLKLKAENPDEYQKLLNNQKN